MKKPPPSHPRARENVEPAESDRPIPKAVFALIVLLFLWGLYYLATPIGSPLLGGDSRTPQSATDDTAGSAAGASGASLYATHCAVCHQANGQGLPGVFPPLAGSEWVLSDSPALPIAVVLYGLHGTIEVAGTAYQGAMPPFGHLPDAEISAVISHIRTSWDNDGSTIDAAAVEQLRQQYGADHPAWDGGQSLTAEFGAP